MPQREFKPKSENAVQLANFLDIRGQNVGKNFDKENFSWHLNVLLGFRNFKILGIQRPKKETTNLKTLGKFSIVLKRIVT